jgi:WD40 repeat protein
MSGAGLIRSLAFSRDGKTLAAGSYEGVIQLWNIASGRQVGTLPGHISFVSSLAFSPDGTALASCSADNTLRIWKVQAANQTADSNPVGQVGLRNPASRASPSVSRFVTKLLVWRRRTP